jgi:DNA-binding NarL/FixJ family response regulator
MVRYMDRQPPTDERALRLVVVDDDLGIRTLLEVAMSLDPRFELIGAVGSGSELLELLHRRDDAAEIDAVLLDVTLPDRDGIELVPDARSVATQARIALFTGWNDPDTLRRAREAGADAVFSKDGDPQKLLDGLAELCR